MDDATDHKGTGKTKLTPEQRREALSAAGRKGGKKKSGIGVARPRTEAVEESRLRLDKLRIIPSGAVVETTAVEWEEREAKILKMEWVFESKGMAPNTWLQEAKGFSDARSKSLVEASGGAASWYTEKEKLKNSVTETLVKRQVDLIAETQDTHITGAKLTMAKAMDMLAHGPEAIDKKTGAKTRWSLRSVDLLNCATAIEKAQKIYRTAIGFGSDEGGLKQILEAIQRTGLTQINIQNNTTIEHSEPDLPPEELAMRDKMTKMSYEDLVEIIEWRREQKRRKEEEAKKK